MTQPNPDASLSSARGAPSIHVQAALTFLAIFTTGRHRHHVNGPVHRGLGPVAPRVRADTGRGAAVRVPGRALAYEDLRSPFASPGGLNWWTADLAYQCASALSQGESPWVS